MSDNSEPKPDPQSLIARHVAHFDEQLAQGHILTRLDTPPDGITSSEWQRYLEARKLLLALRGANSDPDELHWDSEPDAPRYSVVRELGQGGFATVFLAKDNRLKRLVALKVPRIDSLLREDLRQRFLREGESTARLSHPHIVQVFEAVAEGDFSLIVSEYVPGPDLATWIAEHPARVSPRQAAQFLLPLVDAVAHAHARGVLHRDIKPSNVLLNPHPTSANSPADIEAWQPKLADFGIAKLLESQDLTHSGAILGTPSYMAPEQIAGHSSAIGPAVDIYALGMVLYVLLTGTNPLSKTSVHETVLAVAESQLPPLRKQRTDIPRDLETICLKCLRPEPEARYQSALELAADLQRFLTGRPILARKVSPLEKTAKWCKRYPALSLAASTAFLLLITLLVVSRSQTTQVRAALNLAEQRAKRIEQQSYLDDLQRIGDAWNNNQSQTAFDILKRYIPGPAQTDHRDFLWWLLWNRLHTHSRLIGTHPGGAHAVACTQAAPYLAFTGGADGVIKIWSIPDARPVGEFKGHTKGPIQSLELSKDESLLLSAADDGTLRLWDIPTRSQKLVLSGHQGWVATARFSPDNSHIASAGADKLIRIWDAKTGKQLKTLSGHTDTIRSLAFWPTIDTPLLITSSEDKTLRLWNYREAGPWDSGGRVPKGEFDLPKPGWSDSIEFTPNGKAFAVAGIGVFSIEPDNFGELIAPLNGPNRARCIKWLLDDRLLTSRLDLIEIFGQSNDLKSLSEQFQSVDLGDLWDLAPLPNDHGFLSCSANGDVRLWPPSAIKSNLRLTDGRRPGIRSCTWIENLLVTRSHIGGNVEMHAFDAPSRKLLWTKALPQSDLRQCDSIVLPSGDAILFAHKDKLSCLRLDDSEIWTTRLPSEFDDRAGIVVSPNGKFAAISTHKTILNFDTSSGKELHRLELPEDAVTLHFLRDSSRMLVSHTDKIDIWNFNTVEQPREFQTSSKISNFAISPDERSLAASLENGQTVIWSFPDFKELARTVDLQRINSHLVAFVDEGRTLLICREQTHDIHFWYWQQNRVATTLDFRFEKFAVSPDGRQLAVETENGFNLYDGFSH